MPASYAGIGTAINVNELTDKVRIASQSLRGLAQFASPPTGKQMGKGVGDTGQYTFVPDLTTSGGVLDENEAMPTDEIAPVKATFTLKEFGHGVSYTGKLDELSRLDLDDIHMAALMNHREKLENAQCYTQLISTDYKAVFHTTVASSEFVTNGTATQNTNNDDLNLENLMWLRTQAKKQKIPFFDGESYLYGTGPDAINALQSDTNVTNLLKEDSGRAALNGEVGRIAQCRVIEDGYSISDHEQGFDEGILAGADAVVNEVALPWEIRFEISDLGRSKVLAYYGIMCWFKVLDQTTHSQEHIIHVTAAAS